MVGINCAKRHRDSEHNDIQHTPTTKGLYVILCLKDTQHNSALPLCALRSILFIVMLNVVMLSIIMLNVVLHYAAAPQKMFQNIGLAFVDDWFSKWWSASKPV